MPLTSPSPAGLPARLRADATGRPAVPRLAHRTLSSAIVEQLRQGILDGRYPAGTQLRQDALAAEFGTSRIPVREALFQLDAEGLVRIEPHKGAVVAEFSREEIDDVFDLRVLLEPRLLAQSAPRLSAADLAEVAQLDAAFAEAIERQDVAAWGQLNARFHLSLYRHARQPRTLAIVASLLQASDRFTRLQMSAPRPAEAGRPPRNSRTVGKPNAHPSRTPAMGRAGREHHRLLQLCKAGRVGEACEHLAAHVQAVRKDLHGLLPAPTPLEEPAR